MFESDNNFDRGRDSDLESAKNLDRIDANLSPKNVEIRKQQLEKLFLKLIALGLAMGVVLGIGTYYLLTKLGLNKKPYQLEQERLEKERLKQEKSLQALFPAIDVFPKISQSHEQ